MTKPKIFIAHTIGSSELEKHDIIQVMMHNNRFCSLKITKLLERLSFREGEQITPFTLTLRTVPHLPKKVYQGTK